MIVDIVEPNNHIITLTDAFNLRLYEDGSLYIEVFAGSLKYCTCRYFAPEDYTNIRICKE